MQDLSVRQARRRQFGLAKGCCRQIIQLGKLRIGANRMLIRARRLGAVKARRVGLGGEQAEK
jgi:hypothetical protein